MNKKYTFQFYKIENYFQQAILAFVLLILGVFVITLVAKLYGVNRDIVLYIAIAYQLILNKLLSAQVPFYCRFRTANSDSKIVTFATFRGDKIAGIFKRIYVDDESLKIETEEHLKAGVLTIPITILEQATANLLVEVSRNMKEINRDSILEKLRGTGMKFYDKKNSEAYSHFLLANKPFYLGVKIWATILSLITCYIIIYYL